MSAHCYEVHVAQRISESPVKYGAACGSVVKHSLNLNAPYALAFYKENRSYASDVSCKKCRALLRKEGLLI